MTPPVRYERSGAVAVLTLDRPERRNAVNGATAEALHDAYRRFVDDDKAAVLLLTGVGEAFASGADLTELESLVPRVFLPEGPEGFTRLTAPKPAIAAIDGWCVAGGLELALWCDLRIATERSKFGFLERRWGVPLLDGGTQRLPRIIGLGRALDLILTGRVVDAAEALALGLVNRVVGPDAHVDTALRLAEAIAACPRGALLTDRDATLRAFDQPLDAGLWYEARIGAVHGSAALAGAREFVHGTGRGGITPHATDDSAVGKG